jgi:hypothetical protein
VLWAALYLRHFGTDFWGEDAGPHPYDVRSFTTTRTRHTLSTTLQVDALNKKL